MILLYIYCYNEVIEDISHPAELRPRHPRSHRMRKTSDFRYPAARLWGRTDNIADRERMPNSFDRLVQATYLHLARQTAPIGRYVESHSPWGSTSTCTAREPGRPDGVCGFKFFIRRKPIFGNERPKTTALSSTIFSAGGSFLLGSLSHA
ncbi:hypothetical protein SAMN05443246_5265 [Paenibacillus sp. GP183]|nr:hypothetical protein SAMN05443246_5265 [Paenibacillus sp. GP183]